MHDNVDVRPPLSPALDSFAVTCRFEQQRRLWLVADSMAAPVRWLRDEPRPA